MNIKVNKVQSLFYNDFKYKNLFYEYSRYNIKFTPIHNTKKKHTKIRIQYQNLFITIPNLKGNESSNLFYNDLESKGTESSNLFYGDLKSKRK